MCNNHTKIYGKAAVVALIEVEFNPKSACFMRVNYLSKQVESFRNFLITNGSNDPDQVINNIEEQTRKLLRNPTDNEFIWSREHDLHNGKEGDEQETDDSLTDVGAGKEDLDFRMDEEHMLHYTYWNMLENNVNAAKAKAFKETPYIVEKWVEFLEKLQACQEANNGRLPKPSWSAGTKARQRMYVQRKARAMSYEDWALLTNWINRLLGSPNRYDVPETEESETVDILDIATSLYSTEQESQEDSTYVYYTRE